MLQQFDQVKVSGSDVGASSSGANTSKDDPDYASTQLKGKISGNEGWIFGSDDDRLVSADSDLASISDRLRVVSIADEVEQGEKSVDQNAELARFDEDVARTLQAEEAALMRIEKEEEETLMLQQFAASEDNSLMDAKMKARIRPYVDRVKRKITGGEGWISLGPWGELRSKEYWDYKPDGPIMQITISYGYAIDSVLFESKGYDGVIIGSSVKVGGTGGDGCLTKTFCIDSSEEQLSSISLTYDLNYPIFGAVISLCFETNIGNKYGPFGERTGDYSLSIPIQGGVITGFHGHAGAGSWLYAIGIFIAPKVNSLPCSGKKVDSLHSIQDPDSTPTQLKGKGKIRKEEGWIYLGPWGGKDGVDWVYKPDGPIMQISICYGEAINSILFQSKSCDGVVIGSSEKIGGTGGDTTVTFCVDSSVEQLSSIRLTYGDCNGQVAIISICFETKLKKYGPFGLRSGASSLSIPIRGGVLVGFHGRLGNDITAIGIIVAPKNNSLHSIQYPDSALTHLKGKISGEEGWISLGPWGELRGHKYWAYKPDGPIMQITISYGSAIDSILFKSKSYDDVVIGSSVKVGGTGGDGLRTETFCIDSSVEQLSSISLTYGFIYLGAIISICFETNMGTKYGPFGERTGDYSLSIPIEGGVITGFHGLAGDGSWLSAIGIFVAPKVNSLPCSGVKVDSLHSIHDLDSGSTYLKGKGKISEEEGWMSLGPWGGKDGADWVYKPDGPIMQISICYGEAINSILIQSRSCDGFVIGSSEKIGGIGGDTTKTFCIDSSEEQLSSISMTYKDYNGQSVITSLCFESNRRNYGTFGTTSGDARKPSPLDINGVTISGPSSLSIPIEGGVIVGFHGRGGIYLTAIGIFVASKVNNLPSSEKKFERLVSVQDPDYAATQLKAKAKAKTLTICEGKENDAPKVKGAVEPSKGKGKAIHVDKGKKTVAHQADCIGAMDGTHVLCNPPPKDAHKYFGRKGGHTMNIIAICDFDLCFTFASAGWEGSMHDYNVFRECVYGRGRDMFPHPPDGKYYLVDSGYPNTDGYLAPYKGYTYHLEDFRRSRKRHLDAYEYFNRWHSSLRSAIERTFGVWKSRWRMMKETSTYPLRIHKLFVIASMAIHNYIRRHSEHDDEFAEAFSKDERYMFQDMPDINPEYAAQEDSQGFIYTQAANTLDMERVRQGILTALHNDRGTIDQPQRRRRN